MVQEFSDDQTKPVPGLDVAIELDRSGFFRGWRAPFHEAVAASRFAFGFNGNRRGRVQLGRGAGGASRRRRSSSCAGRRRGNAVSKRQLDRPVCSRAPARVFRLMIFEPLRQMHADAMLFSGDGVAKGLDRCVDDGGDATRPILFLQIEVDFNRRENRVVHLGERANS